MGTSEKEVINNITNPNSIYIKVELKFKGYKQYHLHAYIDTGASICVANKHVIPAEFWRPARQAVIVQIADTREIRLDKEAVDIKVNIEGKTFRIPRIYQQETGMDLLIGNNFLRMYSPFVQHEDKIHLTIGQEEVRIPKVKMALSFASPTFLENWQKSRLKNQDGGKNIAPERKIERHQWVVAETPQALDLYKGNPPSLGYRKELVQTEWEEFMNELRDFELGDKIVEHVLSITCSENPLDHSIQRLSNETASLTLKDPTKVIRVKPMSYTPNDREEFKKQIKELLDLKVIRPSKSPHSSPAFLVENHSEIKRGKKRMVINYKALNKETEDDGYYLPKKEELINQIRGNKFYSGFDCKSGFWQVRLEEQSKPLTSFSCPAGQFEWNVVPFGLKQAPGIFQRIMNDRLAIMENSRFVSVYVDDILVYSPTKEQHYKDVICTLLACYFTGTILSAKKAQLFQERINFLGLEITEGEIELQDHVLEKIRMFPSEIKDKTQLQRFLGCLTYVESFIPKLAEARKPLQAKLKKDVSFSWTTQDTEYVEKMKKKFGKLPKLYHPQPEDEMIIETDASHEYWGAVLKARDREGFEQLCRYTSGSFQGAELNYHSNEKEFLAVKKAIKKFSIYVISQEFTVRTDNKQFAGFLRNNIAGDYKQGRLLRWQQWFNHYQFKVEHIEGKKNSLADALTRELV